MEQTFFRSRNKKMPGLLAARIFLVFIILAGGGVALRRMDQRHKFEADRRQVEFTVDLQDLKLLARKTGASLDRILEAARKSGFTAVGVSEDTLDSLRLEGRIGLFSGADLLSLQEVSNISNPEILERMAGERNPEPAPDRLYILIPDPALFNRICGDDGYLDSYFSYSSNPIAGVDLFSKSPFESSESLCRVPGDMTEVKDFGVGLDPDILRQLEKLRLGIVPRFSNAGVRGNATLIRKKIDQLAPIKDQVSAVIFFGDQVLGHPSLLDVTVEAMEKLGLSFGRVEFALQESDAELAARSVDRVTWVHSITEAEMAVYLPQKYSDRYLRAVRERSIRLLYLRAFLNPPAADGGDLLKLNFDYWTQTIKLVHDAGFKSGKPPSFSGFKPTERTIVALLAAVGAAGVLVISLLWPQATLILAGLLILGIPALMFGPLDPNKFRMLAAQAASVLFPLAALWPLLRLRSRKRSLPVTFGLSWALWLYACFATILGGAILAALLSQGEFFLRVSQFSGVKLSLVLPPLIALSAFLILDQPGDTLLAKTYNLIRSPVSKGDAIAAVVAMGVVAVYLMRSGNETAVKPSTLELSARNALEQALIIRPRTKELFGHPAMILFLGLFLSRKWHRFSTCEHQKQRSSSVALLLPLGLIGQVSMMNTFCHFHTEIGITVYRTVLGILIGGSGGLAVLFGVLVVQALWDRRPAARKRGNDPRILLAGYLGMGNRGDDALALSARDKLLETIPGARFGILVGQDKELMPQLSGMEIFDRMNPRTLLRAAAWAHILCFPGGSVLQDVTSARSLAYYTALIRLGRMRGCKIMFLGQGIGPLTSKESQNKVSKTLKRVDMPLVLRDPDSVSLLRDLGLEPEKLLLGADTLLLSDPKLWVREPLPEGTDILRVGIALRQWKGTDDLLKSVSAAMDRVQTLVDDIKFQWVGIPLELPADRDMMTPLTSRENWVWAPSKPGIQGLSDDFKGIDVLVGMRLHSLIGSMLSGIPALAVAYDPKVSGFQTEWEGPCLDLEAAAQSEKLAAALLELVRNLEPARERLVTARDRLQARALDAFNLQAKAVFDL